MFNVQVVTQYDDLIYDQLELLTSGLLTSISGSKQILQVNIDQLKYISVITFQMKGSTFTIPHVK